MRIAICGSMSFSKEMLEAKEQLQKLGHDVIVSGFVDSHLGKTVEESEQLALQQKFENDAMLEYWEQIQKRDAILVLNLDKRGIKNYIGGNSFLEIGFAYVLRKKIFLLNPIPEIEIYKSEIEAVRPIIINGDFSLVK